jgi:hypothetical protein
MEHCHEKKPIMNGVTYLHASHNNDFFLNPKEGLLHKYNFQKSKYLLFTWPMWWPSTHQGRHHLKEVGFWIKWDDDQGGISPLCLLLSLASSSLTPWLEWMNHYQLTNTPWRMDGVWTVNTFTMDSPSLANHGCLAMYVLTTNHPHASNYIPTCTNLSNSSWTTTSYNMLGFPSWTVH